MQAKTYQKMNEEEMNGFVSLLANFKREHNFAHDARIEAEDKKDEESRLIFNSAQQSYYSCIFEVKQMIRSVYGDNVWDCICVQADLKLKED